MKKILGVFAVAALMVLVGSTNASAATVTSQAVFANGQTQVYGNAGQSVPTNFQVHVNAGEVFHAIRTKVDSQPTVCTAVGPFEGDQTISVNVNVTLPPNSSAGGYSLTADLFTTDTVPQAQAMTGDLACSSAGSGAHVFTNAYNGSTVVNVLPANGGNTGGAGVPSGIPADIWAKFLAWIGGASTTPTPTNSPECVAYTKVNTGTQPNVYSDQNAKLQGFLLSQGASIPALKAGASFGFYGNQTTAAVGWFNSIYHCN